jgi:hypothetical protein
VKLRWKAAAQGLLFSEMMPRISVLECLVVIFGDLRTPFGVSRTWLKLHGIEYPSDEQLRVFKRKVVFKAVIGTAVALAAGASLILLEMYLHLRPFR